MSRGYFGEDLARRRNLYVLFLYVLLLAITLTVESYVGTSSWVARALADR